MAKKPSQKKMSVYANLTSKRNTKKDARDRKRAEYLASLPKHPVKRFFYRLHPKRVFGYWFSRRGAIMALKIVGFVALLGVLAVGSLFAYYQRELDSIRPGELAKRVQTTVTKYYDRNNKLLWEDRGDGDYKLVVDSNQISDYAKEATVAIEDKEFYNHIGVDPVGLVRAVINNAQGKETQGGSTLTQQLVKQVFFADEAHDRGWGGIPRKIKELILSVEVERMYNKDQILALYLNQSSYGGRRNGVESGAQTYFGKSAKKLTLPEAALLAGIPNQPGLYDPYNKEGHKALIQRQHRVLDAMKDMGKITQKEADAAKAYPILKKIKPQVSANENIKAPHFVLEVRKQLEAELGKSTVGRGGLTVKTTLDLDAQNAAEKSVATGATMLPSVGADNISLSSVDVKTGQVIAMVGSINYNKEGYGEQNAATSPLEPGSSIKPIADFAPLFERREGVNYAPGSILRDENIDSLYCNGNTADCSVNNYTRRTYGDVTIRRSLAGSLNRPAIKAMHIVGIDKAVQKAKDMGDLSFCENQQPYLSSAIGGGCTVRQVEHANTYATLARGGVYKPLSYVLEVKNSTGETLKKWQDNAAKQALDPQAAYMVSHILNDAQARTITFGSQAFSYGFNVPDVWIAAKTGTTDNGSDKGKDSWLMSYSPAIATAVWSGNHDGRPLADDGNEIVRRVSNDYMEVVHKQVYQKQGKWKVGDQLTRPNGIKEMRVNGVSDIYPSWFDKDAGQSNVKMTFDKVSKKRATNCTPDNARVEVGVTKTKDPITKKEVLLAPGGYDATKEDSVHKCSDVKPSIAGISIDPAGGNKAKITVRVTQGTYKLASLKIQVGSNVVANVGIGGGGNYSTTTTITGKQTITASAEDVALYSGSASRSYSAPTTSDKPESKQEDKKKEDEAESGDT